MTTAIATTPNNETKRNRHLQLQVTARPISQYQLSSTQQTQLKKNKTKRMFYAENNERKIIKI